MCISARALIKSFLCTLLLALFSSLSATGQEALDLSRFEGFEQWPLRVPGDLSTERLIQHDLRIEFAGQFPSGPNETVSTTMIMDLMQVFFKNRPALWIQWSSTSAALSGTTPAIDWMLVDRLTFAHLYRLRGAAGERQWMGPMNLIQLRPEQILNHTLQEDGTLDEKVRETSKRYFEFASLQFLFPFLDLKPGQKFRLQTYAPSDRESLVPILVGEWLPIQDHEGNTHDVLPVELMSPTRTTLITFFVRPQFPYFLGWNFRRAQDGALVSEMAYKEAWGLR